MHEISVDNRAKIVARPVPKLNSEIGRCFLRLANLDIGIFDRPSRYETALWRQAGQILFALDNLDRRKPQERRRRFFVGNGQEPLAYERDEC